ncbi:MAG: NADH:flavin oxidoreductase [Planctomycetes bacterium]|nr:NADH:flavin oxidoreductase [Planctomycetota bacterium]
MAFDLIFQPFDIGRFHLKNRLVFPPAASVTGIVTPVGIAWYERIASGGVGTIIVEGTRLDLFRDSEFAANLAKLADTIHAHDVLAVIQLFQAPQTPGGEAVSVSGTDDARAATTEEVKQIPGEFAHAAKVAFDAGFDGVEPHGAHEFFLNQFFSPLSNTRTDEYGGSLENRMRLGIEVVQAVREVAGSDRLVFYRHTPEQREEGGYTLEDSLEFAKPLDAAGLDVLDVSPSTHNVTPRETIGSPGPHAGLAEAFRDVVACPIMAVGGMNDPAAAQRVLERGKIDLVAICRGLIADAEWPKKVADDRLDEITECIECNEACYGNLFNGQQIACTQWE